MGPSLALGPWNNVPAGPPSHRPWQAEVDNVIHVRMEEVSLLTDYVSLRTRQCTNLAKDWSQVKFRLNDPALNKCKEASFATHFNIKKKMCRMCKSSHFLNQCKHFRKVDYNACKHLRTEGEATVPWAYLRP